MTARQARRFIYLSGGLLLTLLFYLLVIHQQLILLYGLSLVFLMTAFVFSFLSPRPLFLLLAFCLPLSARYGLEQLGTVMILPSEALEGWLLLLFGFRLFTTGSRSGKAFLLHPVTIALYVYLAGSLLSALTSAMPLVSFKSLVVRLTYTGVYYFLLYEAMAAPDTTVKKLFSWYGSALALVVAYTIYRHAGYHFSKDTSGIVALPFFNDHTIYSACIALVLPLFIILAGNKFNESGRIFPIFVYRLLVLLFLAGIFFSYCRATWVSLAAACLFAGLLMIRFRPSWLLAGLCIASILLYLNREMVLDTFRENRYDSNARGAGLEEQTRSITNISSDESNGERLNRWKCAIRMIAERPLTGFGSGTYQFQYLFYQRADEMTRISVTNPNHIEKGHGGSAHNEYLLAFSEGGLMVFLPFVFILLLVFYRGMKNQYRLKDPALKKTHAALLIGLATYVAHGFFNNFLDTDKAAFLFWSIILSLVVIDLQLRRPGTQMGQS